MQKTSGLPYVNRPTTIALTLLINVACVLLSFGFRKSITESNFLINIFICGFLTTVLDVLFARLYIRRLRRAGKLPPVVPASRLVRLLPRNGAALVALLGAFFGFASYGVNWALIRFFAIEQFALWRIVVWQALFACALSSVVMQRVVLRMVQPDCAPAEQSKQRGEVEILIPLPRFDALKRWFNTVTSDFGFNLLVGLLLGGVAIREHNVIIYPTKLSGIGFSSLILSILVLLRMAYPVCTSIAGMRSRGELPVVQRASPLLRALPLSPLKLTLALAPLVILLSYGALWGVMTLFDFQELHFFQYFIIRTIYVAILTKAYVALMVARYRQPDRAHAQSAAS